ncbi:aminoglycoside phosphotransferase family protein [Microlunatus soli]|uniref:Ser/Thr protein kinase RdoA involved in Cpx stress response, MazF antagonist n=1 Tax=Microlunatus soli TaxID=630515 RepID=A0A1H2ALF7_9ACTN|nr:aminoglycoside phosphotransferase family protein [Microlunatus soli]SDT46750.1 Ser/Thr protein kinase RdoA involved in Cpx stress response, MazF antagonist [Microlunatus soli]
MHSAPIPPPVPPLDAEQLLAEVNRHTDAGLRLTGRAAAGEVGAGYVAWPDGRHGVLTRSGAPVSELRKTQAVLERVAAVGIPSPHYQQIVDLGEQRAIIQQRLPGSSPERVDAGLVVQLVDLVETLRGLSGTGSVAPEVNLHLTSSGPGFCVHETLSGYDARSRRLLGRIREIGRDAPPEHGDDLVHLDFHPANVLVDDAGRISGLVDWDGIGRGDRRFALVTLTFDLSFGIAHRDGYRALDPADLAPVLDGLAAAPVERVRRWWASMSLRQVDWTIRHSYPIEVIDFYLALATRGLDRLTADRPLSSSELFPA